MLPYAGVGVVVGGLLGHAAYKGDFVGEDESTCREYDVPVCVYNPYVFTIGGAGYGLAIGSVVGYLRERRR